MVVANKTTTEGKLYLKGEETSQVGLNLRGNACKSGQREGGAIRPDDT